MKKIWTIAQIVGGKPIYKISQIVVIICLTIGAHLAWNFTIISRDITNFYSRRSQTGDMHQSITTTEYVPIITPEIYTETSAAIGFPVKKIQTNVEVHTMNINSTMIVREEVFFLYVIDPQNTQQLVEGKYPQKINEVMSVFRDKPEGLHPDLDQFLIQLRQEFDMEQLQVTGAIDERSLLGFDEGRVSWATHHSLIVTPDFLAKITSTPAKDVTKLSVKLPEYNFLIEYQPEIPSNELEMEVHIQLQEQLEKKFTKQQKKMVTYNSRQYVETQRPDLVLESVIIQRHKVRDFLLLILGLTLGIYLLQILYQFHKTKSNIALLQNFRMNLFQTLRANFIVDLICLCGLQIAIILILPYLNNLLLQVVQHIFFHSGINYQEYTAVMYEYSFSNRYAIVSIAIIGSLLLNALCIIGSYTSIAKKDAKEKRGDSNVGML